jgi:nucleotide-binding universal stress UspA family protein
MQIKSIMVATDFSDPSKAALEYASSLAHDSGATLYIVHVGHFPGSPIGDSELAGYGYVPESNDWQQRRDQLNTIVPTVNDVHFERRYLQGDAADEIVDFATRQNIDLIVMGTHGRTGLNQIVLGSVTAAVVMRAHCPVLTVKQSAVEPQLAVTAQSASTRTC